MTTQFRDTQCGQLIRFLSGNRVLRYSDEINPEACFAALTSRTSGKRGLNVSPEENPQNQLEATEKATVLVDWYGADDPENPQNWSSSWKLFVTFQICIMNFAFYIASSIYVPGEASLEEEFHVDELVATLGLSLFTLGYALGPMLWSPLSELPHLGRRTIYFWTFLAFTLLQLPCGYAPNIAVFLVFRFLAGFVGSPALATGGATIADVYDPARTAYGLCIWGSFGICGPVFGPILGGFAAEARGWRWTIYIVAWMASAVVVLLFFCMPESSAATILYYRAKRLCKTTGRGELRSQTEIDGTSTTAATSRENAATSQLRVLGAAFVLTFTEPIVFVLDLYTALLYGILFLWFESFPFVFGGIYHFTLSQQGLVFIGIFVGGVVTLPLFLLWIRYRIVPRFTQPDFVPEMVLPPTFFGSAALPVCLFFYGWSARESVHWIVPVIGSSFFTVSIITLFNPVLNYLGIAYAKQSASIFAGNALFRASFGAVFPLFARQLFRRVGVGPGNSLLGGIATCFMPLPYIFHRHGKRIRGASKNARHEV